MADLPHIRVVLYAVLVSLAFVLALPDMELTASIIGTDLCYPHGIDGRPDPLYYPSSQGGPSEWRQRFPW
jgi:hypothetical protein